MGDNKPSLITKGRYQLKFRGTECLNCGHLLDVSDKYCPNCSQANSTKKLVLKDFFDEFFSSLINYDSKLLKTLYALLLKPGTITKDYIKGRRIAYTNPFRFLLSLAFLYLLMFTYNNRFSGLDKIADNYNNTSESSPLSFDLNTGQISADSTEVRKQAEQALLKLDSLGLNDAPVSKQMAHLDSLGVFSTQKGIDKDSFMLADPKTYFKGLTDSTGTNKFILKMEFFASTIKHDTLSSFEEAKVKYDIKSTTSNKMAFNFSNSLLRVVQQPSSFLNSTISKLPFAIFFFLPLFTVFIWVVYIRKNYTYTDHLIFSFHNQSLLFILLILSLIVDSIFNTASSGLFLLIFSIYLYKAMRNFYGQGRFKTIVKYLFLNTMFTVLALLVVIVFFTGSVITY
ncbi:hypothetical protein DKG77_13300 [Flagellimonas aquimarina]|uniref:DUF3667 domain-containing protein n=1 Tax=Flagellimonas aquimarina TaxID=2201895 RepID=A0A316KY67_9FLAO|nr:DUF3667 domain-containing protein [Allomuricauda koreensis]PWL37745.1 hypothetical protein DKG77_13300 [Allomuricauda koreensis]